MRTLEPLRWTASAPGRRAIADHKYLLIFTLATFVIYPSSARAQHVEKSKAETRTVTLRILGGDKNVPLADVDVLITHGYGESQKKFGPYRLEADGTCNASLPLGFYSLHLTSDKEWPFLPVEKLWHKRSRSIRPELGLNVKKAGIEKWLDGERREEGYEPPAKPDGAPRITYTLLSACELVLQAVDADSGKGLPGVMFYTENAVGEDWAHDIDGENLGAKNRPDDKPDVDAANLTDKEGKFRRLIGANANYKYGVATTPDGYELVEPRGEVTIDVTYGQASAEQVFKFRRKR